MPETKKEVSRMPQGHANRFQEVERAKNISKTLDQLLQYFSKEKKLVLIMLLVVILGTLCGIYAPCLQSQSIDIMSGSLEGKLMTTLMAMSIMYLLYSACQLLQGLIRAKLSQNIVRQMRQDLFEKMMDLPIQYLDTHSHGDMMSKMTNDIENISTTISSSLPSLFSGVLTMIGTVAMMLYYCWELALLSCTTVILTIIVTQILSKKVRRYSRDRHKWYG